MGTLVQVSVQNSSILGRHVGAEQHLNHNVSPL